MTGLRGLEAGRLKNLAPLTGGALARAIAALNGGGEETRIVGGAVRDLVLGERASDFDLATTALPGEVVRRAEAAGFKVAPTGLAHGTVTLFMDGERIETTTLRQDVETDGRHAKVAFGRDFAADASRRDFTINALSLSADGRVHDVFGGLEDLAAGRVRFIGDADARIREDALRILRFFRFSARFGRGAIDREGLAAGVRGRAGMDRLSRERVRDELLKLLVQPRADEVVRVMGEAGFLEPLIGVMAFPGRFARLIAIELARQAQPDALLRLAALGVAIVENAERLSDRLRLSKAEFRRLSFAASALEGLHGVAAPPQPQALRVLLFAVKRRAARDALMLAQAELTAAPDDRAFVEADRFLAAAREPKLPIGGADLAARGIAEGPRVGEVLGAFQALWAAAGFPADPSSVDRLVTQAERGEGVATPNRS